ncbi:hypothetical protein I3843_12G066300 [Carya illinoinensis]|nr:hypothetical protein I3843_12G066300 [Carya illinoinensis]
MTLVRERRHRLHARLSLPRPKLAFEFQHQTQFPTFLSCLSPNSPVIKNLSDLEKIAILGHGGGDTVYKVLHKKTVSIYTLKMLRVNQNNVNVHLQVACEVDILKQIDSQYIITCLAIFDNHFASVKCGGDLCFDMLRAQQRLPEQVISGIAKRMVHRDIKLSNLLVNDKGEVKIANFGVSHLMERTHEACDSNIGTCTYMSPERFDLEGWGGDDVDGFIGDVWSLGVVVLECHVASLMCAICFAERLEMPKTASIEFQSFVRRCLEKDWRKRGTVAELLGHPFVNKRKRALISILGQSSVVCHKLENKIAKQAREDAQVEVTVWIMSYDTRDEN